MKETSNKKKQKEKWVDDGRTIADMNVPGMPWNAERGDRIRRKKPDNKPSHHEPLQLTKGERRAMIMGAFLAVLPFALVIFLGFFFIVFVLDFFWLN